MTFSFLRDDAHMKPLAPEDEGGAGDEQEGGGDESPWSGLDSNIQGLMETKGYKSGGDVAQAYYHLSKLHGGAPDVVAMPDTSDPEQMRDMYSRLGLPEDVNGYDIQLGEDIEVDDHFLGHMKGVFHTAGVNNEQAQMLTKEYIAYTAQREESTETEKADALAAQREEVEKKFGDKLDLAVARGQDALKQLGLEREAVEALESNIGAPAVMTILATLGEKIGSEDIHLDGLEKNQFGMTAGQAEVEMERLKNNPEFFNSLFDNSHPAHRTNLRRWDDLQTKAFGG